MSVRSHPAAGFLPLSAQPKQAAGSYSLPSLAPDTHPPASNPFAFGLFLLLNAVLFIRPSEIFPDLAEVPIYYYVILPCIVLSLPALLFRVLTFRSLAEQPISLCVLGLLPLSLLSLLGKVTLDDTQALVWEFAKALIYFLLLIANVSTPGRIRLFLGWLVFLITILTGIAVLQWHEIIDIGLPMSREQAPDPEGSGLELYIYRLQATGIFNDPNDLCLVLGMGIILYLSWFGDRSWGLLRVLWLTPIPLFGYALSLTQSRGGLVGVLVGVLALFHARFGWKAALALAVFCLPGFLLLSGTRQGDFDLNEGTGQDRVQLWSEGIALFKESPLTGIGFGQYAEQVHQVAHNSFVHAFVELGFFGGVLFAGAVYLAGWSLYRLAGPEVRFVNAEMRRLRPYLLAMVGAYTGGMLTLSRCYVAPTYLVLGLVAAYISTAVRPSLPVLHCHARLAGRIVVAAICSLVLIIVVTRVLVQFK
jgi:O-antigen ligase